jgi:hypothetical protein
MSWPMIYLAFLNHDVLLVLGFILVLQGNNRYRGRYKKSLDSQECRVRFDSETMNS